MGKVGDPGGECGVAGAGAEEAPGGLAEEVEGAGGVEDGGGGFGVDLSVSG